MAVGSYSAVAGTVETKSTGGFTVDRCEWSPCKPHGVWRQSHWVTQSHWDPLPSPAAHRAHTDYDYDGGEEGTRLGHARSASGRHQTTDITSAAAAAATT